MKLRQIVIDKTDLTLVKEKEVKVYGEVFEVSDARGKEILAATYKGAPVAEIVEEEKKETTNKVVGKKSTKKEEEKE